MFSIYLIGDSLVIQKCDVAKLYQRMSLVLHDGNLMMREAS